MIETSRLGRRYGRTVAVSGVDLSLGPGETLAVLGPNGAGKTTLLKLLATAIRPTEGTGRVGGHDLAKEAEAVRAVVGFLGHGSYLYEELTALENLAFVAAMRGLPADRRRLLDALEGVGLGRHAGQRVRAFSAGMKRRLSLARVRLAQPAVLLIDEPYAGLDQRGALLFEAVVAETAGRGGAVVMATHQLARAHEVAGRVAILAGNRLAYAGRADETDLDGLRHLYARCTEEGVEPPAGGPDRRASGSAAPGGEAPRREGREGGGHAAATGGAAGLREPDAPQAPRAGLPGGGSRPAR